MRDLVDVYEEARYAAVSAQITQLLDEMKDDSSPLGIASFGKAWLAAEMYGRNEEAHAGYQARIDLVTILERRIHQMEARP